MSLVATLLTAIVRADGDALVLHTGECPYVVAPAGQTEVASRPLALGAMTGLLGELLSPDARQALDELGAVQRDLVPAGFPGHERFTVIAARGGDDIWIEIRRHRRSAPPVEPEPRPASVRQIPRQPARSPSLHPGGIDRLLRIAAERGASALYITSQGRPCIRVEGKIGTIEGESVLSEPEVEDLILEISPGHNQEMLRSQAGTEWVSDIPDIGRIRGRTFRDHRGPGAVLRMISARSVSAEQLGLSGDIKGLCSEADGLVLVTGPRASGKSTLLTAFVHLINRTRSEHVITLEHQIDFVHEGRSSLVSQREVRGGVELMAAARAALREKPDVLAIEDLESPDVMMLALEAAREGHLVIGALTAHTATGAVDRIIDQTPPDRRAEVLSGLAASLRGVVAQLLLRRTGGGYVAAREVLVNTGAVSRLIAEGRTHGTTSLNEALAGFVSDGVVESREAYRQAADKQGFLALLRRHGIETSFLERSA